MYVCSMQCPHRPENGVKPLATGIRTAFSIHEGAGSQAMVPDLLHKQHTLNYKSSLQPSTSAFNLGHYSLKVEAYSITFT